MEAGREHTGTPFIWPPQLIFEHPRPITVYLDLNFWIGLAQASVGHTGGGRYQALFEQASALVKRNRVMFPLSAQHYMEMSARAAVIGEINDEHAGMVVAHTPFGGSRIVDMLVGAPLPRIC